MHQDEYIEYALHDRVVLKRSVNTPDYQTEFSELIVEFLPDILEEEMMNELLQHLGDGGARVSIGGELATSIEYGNKAGVHCTVSVTCNNDIRDVQAVHGLLFPWVKQQIERNLVEMEAARDSIMRGEKITAPPPGAPAAPPKKNLLKDYRR